MQNEREREKEKRAEKKFSGKGTHLKTFHKSGKLFSYIKSVGSFPMNSNRCKRFHKKIPLEIQHAN